MASGVPLFRVSVSVQLKESKGKCAHTMPQFRCVRAGYLRDKQYHFNFPLMLDSQYC